ncbi:MAG TPA: tRNA (guanosine(46)-N7)-methyltransferase TrmB [Candidatus Nanopelagicales bacterium]|jgi:tRNA (guanine-N7-)-methyltransferase|nr:tRNA (guanosine(46)-N7)-methyltransferase TrmB [Candidatus Nanopelagicales bacterium]
MTSASSPEPPALPRGVRTFHPRRGRLTAQQRERVVELLDRYGIPASGPLDLTALLTGRPAVVEIGFGMGEATFAMAVDDPRTGVLAVDIHTPGVLRLLTQVDRAGLPNLRVAHEDALELLRTRVAAQSLAGIRVFFPDPWPKVRHHKRRLVQPGVVRLLAARLRPGGYLHLATDVPEYAAQMISVVEAEPLLHNEYHGFAPGRCGRPLTRYESQALVQSRSAADVFVRRV